MIKTSFIRIATAAGSLLVALAVPLSPLALVNASSQYVTLDQFSGHPGATLSVSGGGYQPGQSVHVFIKDPRVSASPSTSATVTASVTGSFGPVSVTVPFKLAQGPVEIDATDAANESAQNSYYVAPYSPAISASAAANTPGSLVSVDGSGFAAGEPVQLVLASSQATATADATGSFAAATLTIPQVVSGTSVITATGSLSDAKALAYFYVGGFYPSSAPSTYYLLPGHILSFSGSGYAPSETVNVLDGKTLVSSFSVSATGAFKNAGGFTIPVSAAGSSHTYTLHGVTSNGDSSASVTVGSFFPNVSPSAYYLMPGSTLAFDATGFAPSETVTVTAGTSAAALATATADADGALTAAAGVVIPFESAGSSATYTLTGSMSHGSATASVTVGQYSTNVSPSDYYVLPGQNLSFSGSGFVAGESVNAFRGKETTPYATFLADPFGTFKLSGIDAISYALANGSADYNIVGAQSKTQNKLMVSVGQLNAQISPSDYYLRPAQEFTLSGTGFGKSEVVSIAIGTQAPVTVTADKFGGFATDGLKMPFSDLGSVPVVATGATSHATATVSIALGSYYPYASSDSYYARQGTVVNVQGNSFADDETVTVSAGTYSVDVPTDAFGSTDVIPVLLPFGTFKGNQIVITLTGSVSKAVASVPVTLAPFAPQVSPSTYYATPGSPVSFTGSGFLNGETVSIAQGTKTIGSVVASAKGDIASASFPLPFGTKGTADYTLAGQTSGGSVSVSVSLSAFYAGISLNNYYATGGSAIVVSGSGMLAGETASLTFGGAPLPSVTVNAMGAYSLATTVPFAAAGNKAVTVTGLTSGATATTTFTQAPVYTTVQLKTYALAPGSAVTFIGSGYMPGEPVKVTSDRGGISYTFKAGADGTFSDGGLTLPVGLAQGNLTLSIAGTQGFTSTDIVMYVLGL